MSVSEKVCSIIAKTFNIPESVVNMNLAVGDIPQWDSMGNLAIFHALEEEFQVEFEMEELFELNSVKSFVERLTK